jgi:hypothetical protein
MPHKFFQTTLFLTIALISGAQNKNASYNFEELNQCIVNKKIYSDAKIHRIHDLLGLLEERRNTSIQKFNICSHLYQEYKTFQYDSAFAYATRMLNIAEHIGDVNLIGESRIALSFSCRSGGLYKEAYDLLYSIDPQKLNPDVRTDLFAYRSSFNIELAQFFGKDPYYTKYYNESLEASRMTAKIATHEDISVISAKVRILELEKDYRGAIRLTTKYLKTKKPDQHDYAMLAANIAGYLLTLKDTTQAIRYYIAASVADIKSATKETTAIRILAEILYKQKDFKSAHSYIMQALDDANFYNARQRKIQVGNIFPIIEAERFDVIKQQKNSLLIYSVLISILGLLFLLAIFVILKQTTKLNRAKKLIQKQNEELLISNEDLTCIQKEINKQNKELLQINDKLKETHRIKEEYIGYFFSASSTYLQKLDDYRKLVNRKIRNKQIEELMQLNNAYDIQQERENMFALFDQIFLKLFPDFVNQFNLLFKPEDQIVLRSENILTSELRIFALIRLGITESERIASFLDYSIHTVNNYKTKVKNRSIVPNELFEQKIMEIESIKTNIES